MRDRLYLLEIVSKQTGHFLEGQCFSPRQKGRWAVRVTLLPTPTGAFGEMQPPAHGALRSPTGLAVVEGTLPFWGLYVISLQRPREFDLCGGSRY